MGDHLDRDIAERGCSPISDMVDRATSPISEYKDTVTMNDIKDMYMRHPNMSIFPKDGKVECKIQ